MKKRLINCLMLFTALSCTCLYSCAPKHPSENVSDKGTFQKTSADGIAPTDTTSISESEARSMVRLFRSDVGFYTKKTSAWFSRKFINKLDSLLKADSITYKADGIRIYLARKGKMNTFLIVTTKNNGQNPDFPRDTTKNIHLDYFTGSLSTSTSATRKPIGQGSVDRNDEGACLNHPKCPSGSGRTFTNHFISCENGKKYVCDTLCNVNDAADLINTQCEWFEIGFVHYLKAELDAANNARIKGDGVRVYLGKRDDTVDSRNKPHVFIIVTTIESKNNKKSKHIDDYEEHLSNKDINKFFSTSDNGEQCLNNCHGVTLN